MTCQLLTEAIFVDNKAPETFLRDQPLSEDSDRSQTQLISKFQPQITVGR